MEGLRVGGVNLWSEELSTAVKEKIEEHWRKNLREAQFDESSEKQKFYVLSMFPYPSGQLHMGHVRVYSISDAIARFHRMRGQNVLQPMGWDAFGLPAENAARLRKLDPDRWTQSNIATMKDNMEMLNLSFDWSREFATCDSDYYKWTQYLFLKLYENDLVYRKEALVNWDPIDETVLADEQVDANGRSWRSGAKVVKKKLKQWFIRTTRFSKALSDGLDDPELKDWRDIIKIQKHWIGNCNGTNIDFQLVGRPDVLTLWTETPEFVDQAQFIAIRPNSFYDQQATISAQNPFTSDTLPVFVTDAFDFPEGSDTYLGIPDQNENDKQFALDQNVYRAKIQPVFTEHERTAYRKKICAEAKRRGIGGWPTSSKIRDWLISRQRFWGTPIPIIHCPECGPRPVPENRLPVKPDEPETMDCPKCGAKAARETDTMDTFVDSAWYYLRFLDPDNTEMPFSPDKATKFMPVDIYVGGKEHALLHLYYARFFAHFLHSAGVLATKEPFKRLLVQGIVKGKTYRSKTSGAYVPSENVVDGVHVETGEALTTSWEKMSKSKHNGVDPLDMFREFGCDSTRLIILADVAPTSSRNWSRDTFQGVLGWQHRLWLTLQNFLKIRNENLTILTDKSEDFVKEEQFLWDSRNFYVKGVTFNFVESYQLSVAISKMQGLTNSLRKSTKFVIGLSKDYEEALAAQLIMLAPIAPHFAAELWAGFLQAPNRLSDRIIWHKPVNLQPWPKVDSNYCLDLQIRVNRNDVAEIKIPKCDFDRLRHQDALRLARNHETVNKTLANHFILRTGFQKKKDCTAIFTFYSQTPKTSLEDNALRTEVTN